MTDSKIEVFVNSGAGSNVTLEVWARTDVELNGDAQFVHTLIGDTVMTLVLDEWVKYGNRSWIQVGQDGQERIALAWTDPEDSVRIVTIGVDDTTWLWPLDRLIEILPYNDLSFERLDRPSPEGS
jgi:hypothetical protein